MPKENIKPGSWLADIIEAMNSLGGQAKYKDIYIETKKIRQKYGRTWTQKSEETIRREIENNSSHSKNYTRKRDVFYPSLEIGKGTWSLNKNFTTEKTNHIEIDANAYAEGVEGHLREYLYLAKSRNKNLVEQRKKIDNCTCRSCGYFLRTPEGQYIIDVHHINPLGDLEKAQITKIDELICLCPNCHRIAHTRKNTPLSLAEIKEVISIQQREKNNA